MEEEEEEEKTKKRTWLSCFVVHFEKWQWLVIIAMSLMSFFAASCISLQGPFYPQEAEKRGVTASEYGLVFGIFEFVAIFSCPIYGKYIYKVGAKQLVVFGIMLEGLCTILFGLLDMIKTHLAFLSLSFTLRIMESLGSSAAHTASMSLVSYVFPHDMATAFGALECSFTLGFTLGPLIGGCFYQIGGYTTPFAVVGCLLLLDGLFNAFVLPSTGGDKRRDTLPVPSIVSVFKLPSLVLDFASMMAVALSMGFIMPTLEPHLRQFNLSHVEVGSLFGLISVTGILVTPLVGRLCDKWIRAKKLIVFGALCVMACFALIGPLPFIPVNTTLWMVCVGLLLQGLAMSCIVIPASADAIREAIRGGLPDDISTYGVVNGLTSSSYAFGVFVGSSISGVLLDTVGFRQGSLLVIGIHVILAVVLAWFEYTDDRPAQYSTLHESSEAETTTTNLCQYGTTTE